VTTSVGVTVNVSSARRKNRRAGVCIPPAGDKHVDDLPVLVDGPVHVAPHPVDLDVCLVNEPAVAGRVAAEPRCIREQRREPPYPPVDGDLVDLDTALDQQLLHVAVGQAVAQIPPDRHHDHLGREPKAREGAARRSRRSRTGGQLHRSRMA
jgi:hypothetical protein